MSFEKKIENVISTQAASSVALRDAHICTLRVCEVLLHLLDFLLDMGLLKASIAQGIAEKSQSKGESEATEIKTIDIFLSSIIR